jgi:pimeloyl-ACP methyl ester carboxylesterase
MADPGALRSATEGREARARYAETFEFDPHVFTAADWTAVEGPWRSLGDDAGRAGSAGPDGGIDDDIAYASPWGFDVERVRAPVLIAHGGEDRVIPAMHGDWLVRHVPNAELWLRPRDGHISILDAVPLALDWLLANASDLR